MAPEPDHAKGEGVEAATTKAKADDQDVRVFYPAELVKQRRMPRWLQTALSEVVLFVTIHYNLWSTCAAFVLLYMLTHGRVVLAVTLVLLYLPSFLSGVEKTAEGGQWNRLRQSRIWLNFQIRWRLVIHREQPLDADKQYIFGYHPHGLSVMSRIASYAKVFETLFPGVDCRALAATTVFRVPLARELCLWMGAVDASRATAMNVLEAGKSIIVYPGGIKEMYTMDPKSNDNVLVLKSRLGFVKLALRHGADLVPVMVFNEKHMYHLYTPPPRVHAFLRKWLPFPAVFFYGRFLWMPLRMPKDKPFGIVYGKPIPVTKVADPTDDQVRALHATYMHEVERLFREYKDTFGYGPDERLVIT